MLNSAQVKNLFCQEAVLFGTVDGVPLSRISDLFGEEVAQAVVDAKNQKAGTYYNIWGTKHHSVTYIYFAGFQYAATVANVIELCSKEELSGVTGKVVELPRRRAAK